MRHRSLLKNLTTFLPDCKNTPAVSAADDFSKLREFYGHDLKSINPATGIPILNYD